VSRHRAGRAAAALSILAAMAGALGTGCGDAIVGGSCAEGYAECDLHCVLLSSDPANCGSCGLACQTGEGCFAGRCGTAMGADATPGDDAG